VLRSVLFPLVAPGVIATSIFAFIAAWNDYLVAYTFMKDQTMYTLPVWLASFSNPLTGTDFGSQMAASVLFSLPVVVFFLFIQRNLVAGMSAGAVKG
jgi:N,N'-diacetylchitobiose transport system permease protein